MQRPHFRRAYELLAYGLSLATPLVLVVVIAGLNYRMLQQASKIDRLQLEVATIKANLSPTANAATYTSSTSGTNPTVPARN